MRSVLRNFMCGVGWNKKKTFSNFTIYFAEMIPICYMLQSLYRDSRAITHKKIWFRHLSSKIGTKGQIFFQNLTTKSKAWLLCRAVHTVFILLKYHMNLCHKLQELKHFFMIYRQQLLETRKISLILIFTIEMTYFWYII